MKHHSNPSPFVRSLLAVGLVLALTSCGGGDSDSADLGPTVMTQQPQSQVVPVGSAATFSVALSGSPASLMQWMKGSEAIPAANDTTYTTPPTTATDDGLMFRFTYYATAGHRAFLVSSQPARLSVVPPLPSGPGSYATGPSMVMSRSWHIAVRLPSGSVLLAGGRSFSSTSSEVMTSAEVYDPASNTFVATGPMSTARQRGHGGVLLPNGKVLICGGQDADSRMVNSAEIYDPATGRFTTTGSMQFARSGHAVVLLPNGKVLVAGGADADHILTAEIYDPADGVFRLTSPMNLVRNTHQGVPTAEGALIVGGKGSERFIAASATFLQVPISDAIDYLDGMSTTLLAGGQIAVVGGYDMGRGGAQKRLAEAHLFDPATGTFAATGSLNWPRANASATALKDGRLLVLGGDGNARLPERAEVLDPATGVFTPTVSTGAGRTGHTATLLLDGRVLIAGGNAAMSPVGPLLPAATSLFTP